MERFKRLGVFLHNSPADETALTFAGVFATIAHSELVHCVHVREPDLDEDAPTVEALENEVRRRLPKGIARITKVEVHAEAGVPAILRTARDDELDLIIVGRRLPSEQLGIGSAFARLARKSPCSVLVTPSQARPHLDRMFVPVDFSEHSKLALEEAIAIARTGSTSKPQLVVHSNFTIGYGYTKLGLTLPKAIAERKALYESELQTFVAGVDTTGFDVDLVCTSAREPESAILEVAVARKMDLIVVGSRGTGSVLLLGSTAERILLSSLLPVLVVKKKGETYRILDILLESS